MSISNISIKNFRNLKEVNLNFSSKVNIFYGLNGSGKTSMLECIFFLSRARSFKQPISNKLISFGEREFLILAHNSNSSTIGISKNYSQRLFIKYNNCFINSSFILSQNIILQILSPDSYLLLESGPTIRRKFMDWFVFHVKHNLFTEWKRYKSILKQRNFALKSKLSDYEISAWDGEFTQLTEIISDNRSKFVQLINSKLSNYKIDYLDNMELIIDYYPGWNCDLLYSSVLADTLKKDKIYGFTQFGLHKSDFKLKIKINNNFYLVKDVLSNGLKKYLSMMLLLIQIELFIEHNEINQFNKPVLLIDDITSEIDSKYSNLLMSFISKLNIQLFITFLETVDNRLLIKSFINDMNKNESKLFHVKQGCINEINKSMLK